jgi:hypothetical protein
MRAELRRRAVPQSDIESVVTVLARLGNLSGRALQGAIFKGVWDEPTFQPFVREELRSDRLIGSLLEEHAHAGAGVTDLSFRGIRIELKAEHEGPLVLADCQRFVEQAASYAVGSAKRTAVLCVLDTSAKTTAPPPAEDSMGVLLSSGGVSVPTVLVHGNLALPSKLSRTKAKEPTGRHKTRSPKGA